MQAQVQQADFKDALRVVKVAANNRSSLPVLGNILVEAGAGRLRVAASNLEISIAAHVDAEIEQAGQITVPAETLADLVSTLPPTRVTLKTGQRKGKGKNGKKITIPTLAISCDGSKSTFKGIDADEFPVLPTPEGEPARVPAQVFKRMVEQVAFAALRENTVEVLTGVLVQFEAGHLTMAATDRYRLAVNLRDNGTVPLNASFVIPPKALEIAAQCHVEESGHVEIYELNNRQIMFCAGGFEITAQRLDGKFPDYTYIIPAEWKTRAVVDRAAFLAACKQATPFARENGHTLQLQIWPANGDGSDAGLSISAQSKETGNIETHIQATTVEGESMHINLDIRYLTDALATIRTKCIAIETTKKDEPVVLRPEEKTNSYTHVIMPVSVY